MNSGERDEQDVEAIALLESGERTSSEGVAKLEQHGNGNGHAGIKPPRARDAKQLKLRRILLAGVVLACCTAIAVGGVVLVSSLIASTKAIDTRPQPHRVEGLNYLSQHTRPLFFNEQMFFNTSTECDIPIAITADKDATDVWIGDIYSEDRGEIDHSEQHWQTKALFDIESNPLQAYKDAWDQLSKGLPSFYDILITHEFDAHLTYLYYMVTKFKDLRAPPIPFKEKLQEPVAAVVISNCNGPHSWNNRQAIVDELIRLLPGRIYSYGECSHNREFSQDADVVPSEADKYGNWEEGKQKLLRKHKFYLAFENACVVDYVTEKCRSSELTSPKSSLN